MILLSSKMHTATLILVSVCFPCQSPLGVHSLLPVSLSSTAGLFRRCGAEGNNEKGSLEQQGQSIPAPLAVLSHSQGTTQLHLPTHLEFRYCRINPGCSQELGTACNRAQLVKMLGITHFGGGRSGAGVSRESLCPMWEHQSRGCHPWVAAH